MGKMVTDTMDHMDVVSRITVNMHDLEQAQADEDSRDKAIDESWSTKSKEESPSLESIEKELDNVEVAKLAGIEAEKPKSIV